MEKKKDPEVNRLKNLVELGRYPFTYDGTTNRQSDPGCDVDEFRAESKVVVELTIHAMDFGSREYHFRLQSIVLIADDEESEKHVSPLRTP